MTPLRQKVIDQMTLQGLSTAIQKSYLYQLTEVAKYFHIHKGYFLPVKLLSNRFRGTMVSELRQAYEQGELSTIEKATLDGTLSHLMSHPWVVYCKSALEYRDTLVSYLARYTYRVGLSNHRLESWKDNRVTLSYFDNKSNKASRLSLEPKELIRRFLLHILLKSCPEGLCVLGITVIYQML